MVELPKKSNVAYLPFDMLDRLPHLGGGNLPQGLDIHVGLLATSADECLGAGADIALARTDVGSFGGQLFIAAASLGDLAGLPTGACLGGGLLANGVGLALGFPNLHNGFLRQVYTFFLSNAVKRTQNACI